MSRPSSFLTNVGESLSMPSGNPGMSRFRWGVAVVLCYAAVLVFYSGLMTGFTFVFSECEMWPNYDQLAKAFAKGRLDLDVAPTEDHSVVNGRVYLYSGPVPALLRLPVVLLLGRGIPTGFMIAMFCAGVSVLSCLALNRLDTGDSRTGESSFKLMVGLVIVLNGYTLFLVTIPSFHHEAIAAAMFFLIAAISLVLRIRDQAHQRNVKLFIALGVMCALCLGSRLNYGLSIVFLGVLAGICAVKGAADRDKVRVCSSIAVMCAITLLGVMLLGLYNYERYGTFMDTGMQYQVSKVFGKYFREGNYFRYDHVPLNLWSYFCRIPDCFAHFPYIGLPVFTATMQSVQFMPYSLVYHNELAVSVFCMVPLGVLLAVPVACGLAGRRDPLDVVPWVACAVVFLQVLPLSLTVATAARYYVDFVPIVLMATYPAAVRMFRWRAQTRWVVGVLALVSLMVGLTLPVHGVLFYDDAMHYRSPWAPLIFSFLK
ncbi:MAG: hypothetical protein AB1646_05635 [Thermodesulfobacteriota bacterium]